MMDKNPKAHFVAALLDIDDFKFINDIYGHAYGDKALKSLADSMKAFFPPDVLLGRNGGDIMTDFGQQVSGLADNSAIQGLDSTILDLSGVQAKILRQGAISQEDLLEAVTELNF